MHYHPFHFKITSFYKGVKQVREPSYRRISSKIEDDSDCCVLISQRIKKNQAVRLGKRTLYLNVGDIFYNSRENIFYIYSLIKEPNSNGVKAVGFKKVLKNDNESIIHLYDLIESLKEESNILKYVGNLFADVGIKQIMFYIIKRYKNKNIYKTINSLNKILELNRKRILDIYLVLNIKNKKGVMSYGYQSIINKPGLIKMIKGWDIVLSCSLGNNIYENGDNYSNQVTNYFYTTTGTLIHFVDRKRDILLDNIKYKDFFENVKEREDLNDLFYRTKDMLVLLNENGKISYYSFMKKDCYLVCKSHYIFYLNSDLYEHVNRLKDEDKFNKLIVSLI